MSDRTASTKLLLARNVTDEKNSEDGIKRYDATTFTETRIIGLSLAGKFGRVDLRERSRDRFAVPARLMFFV